MSFDSDIIRRLRIWYNGTSARSSEAHFCPGSRDLG
jgi:hypothetical protein